MASSIEKQLAELRESLSTSGMSRSQVCGFNCAAAAPNYQLMCTCMQISSVLRDTRATLEAGASARPAGSVASTDGNGSSTAPRASTKRGAAAPLSRDSAAKRARPASQSDSDGSDEEPAPSRSTSRGRSSSARGRGAVRRRQPRVASSSEEEEEEEESSSADDSSDDASSDGSASTQDVNDATTRRPPPQLTAPPPVIVQQPSLQSVLERAREKLKSKAVPATMDVAPVAATTKAAPSDASDVEDEDDAARPPRVPPAPTATVSRNVSTSSARSAPVAVPAGLAMPPPLRMPTAMHFPPAATTAPVPSPPPPPASLLSMQYSQPPLALPTDTTWPSLSRDCVTRMATLCDAMRAQTGTDPAILLRAVSGSSFMTGGGMADSPTASSGTPASVGAPAASPTSTSNASSVMFRVLRCRSSVHVPGDDDRIADMVRAWERTPVGMPVQLHTASRPQSKSLMWWGIRPGDPVPGTAAVSAGQQPPRFATAPRRESAAAARSQEWRPAGAGDRRR